MLCKSILQQIVILPGALKLVLIELDTLVLLTILDPKILYQIGQIVSIQTQLNCFSFYLNQCISQTRNCNLIILGLDISLHLHKIILLVFKYLSHVLLSLFINICLKFLDALLHKVKFRIDFLVRLCEIEF